MQIVYKLNGQTAHPRPPRHRPRRLPRRKTSPPTRRRRRRLHLLRRLHKNPRKHPQGHLRRRRQHIWLLDAESMEGDEVGEEPVG